MSVNIEIMRAFVRLRQLLASNAELARRLDELESKYDKQLKIVFDAIRHLMITPARGRKEIGFVHPLTGEFQNDRRSQNHSEELLRTAALSRS